MKNILSQRQKRILSLLKEHPHLTGKQISSTLGISVRTLQSDIAQINQKKTYIQSNHRGYHLDLEAAAELLFDLERMKGQSHILLKKLIFSYRPVSIQELADELYMSASTLLRNLESYRSLLQCYDLTIYRKNNKISLQGSEYNKRRFINYLISQEIDPYVDEVRYLNNFFPDIDIKQMKRVLLKTVSVHHYYINEAYFSNLFLNILIAFDRMKNGAYIENESSLDFDQYHNIYKIATDLVSFYKEMWRLDLKGSDIVYLSSLLYGQIQSAQPEDHERIKEVLTSAFISDVDRILSEVFSYFMLDINFEKQLYSFALHIDALIKRARSHSEVKNDLLESIQMNSPFVYDIALAIAEKISDRFQISVSAQEIGYISIHLGFLIENSLKENNIVNVMLICTPYLQLDQRILKQLTETYGNQINLFTSKLSDRSSLVPTVDIVISINPVQIPCIQNVIISPFFNSDDQQKVDQAIYQAAKEKERKKSQAMLASYFRKDLFFKMDSIQKKEDALLFLGQKIQDSGLVDESFIDSVYKREEMSSTCFFDTFAIPHAMEMNAKKSTLGVLINKEGIEWDPPTKIPIVLMIAVCKSDRKEFAKLYSSLIKSLCDEQKRDRLLQAEDFDDFIHVLQNR